jgi:drug/metabolite transporter (DMT)-like permease
MEKKKGIVLAYLTAIVSGVSVFANSFGVLTLDATAYTFLKNAAVALLLAAVCVAAGNWREFASLKRKQALMLLFAGVIGGGAAFALYFSGLAAIGGATGSFLYRLLFVFAAIIAVGFLKEKFEWKVAAGALAIIAGNFVLLSGAALSLSQGALLVLAATALWAAEYAVSKKALESLSPATVAAARMGIGAIVLLAIIAASGNAGALSNVSAVSIGWIAIATAFLFAFTTLWYSALKSTSLISATAAFTLGGPISAFLSFALAGKALAPAAAGGLLLVAIGCIFAVGAAETVAAINWAGEKVMMRLRL